MGDKDITIYKSEMYVTCDQWLICSCRFAIQNMCLWPNHNDTVVIHNCNIAMQPTEHKSMQNRIRSASELCSWCAVVTQKFVRLLNVDLRI